MRRRHGQSWWLLNPSKQKSPALWPALNLLDNGQFLVLKEPLELTRRQRGIAGRVLGVGVAQIYLWGAGIDAIVGQLVAAGVPQHMGMHLDAQLG